MMSAVDSSSESEGADFLNSNSPTNLVLDSDKAISS